MTCTNNIVIIFLTLCVIIYYCFFFFQAEDGIRDIGVTGVQTCALPISFNVFQYITFRSVFAALTAFVIALLFGNYTIRKLLSLKLGQPIRTADEVNKIGRASCRERV